MGCGVDRKDNRLISREIFGDRNADDSGMGRRICRLLQPVYRRTCKIGPAVVPEDALTTEPTSNTKSKSPFNSVVVGGKAQVTLRRSSGKTETIEVNIPPGIESGKKNPPSWSRRRRGLRGGKPGDILLTVHVGEHPYFQRQGSKNLLLRLPITLEEAVLGGKIGRADSERDGFIEYPQNAPPAGQKLRVKGHGVQTKDGQPGDLLVETRIVLPKQIDEVGCHGPESSFRKIPDSEPTHGNSLVSFINRYFSKLANHSNEAGFVT